MDPGRFFVVIGVILLVLVAAIPVLIIGRKRNPLNPHALLEGPVVLALAKFSLPLFLASFFQQLYGLSDTIIIGQALGKEALAAAGLVTQIFSFLIVFSVALTQGGAILIAQYFGAKRFDRLKLCIDSLYLFAVGLSIVFIIICVIFARFFVVKVFAAPPEIVQVSVVFLRNMAFGLIFTFGYNAVAAVLRGSGDSATSLLFLIFASILNILLVLLFVKVFRWGMAGAAWATNLAQAFSLFLSIMYMRRKPGAFKFAFRGIRLDLKIFMAGARLGLPAALQQVVIYFSFFAMIRMVNGFGLDAAGAYAACSRLDGVASLPGLNVALAVSTFVGQCVGAKKFDRLAKGVFAGAILGGGATALVSAVLIIFRNPLLSLFLPPNSGAAMQIGSMFFLIIGWFYAALALFYLYTAAAQGAGDTRMPFLITVLVFGMIRLPLAHLFRALFGLNGIWMCFSVSWSVACALAILYWRSGRWRKCAVLAECA